MKFVTLSNVLLEHLQNVGKVISNKSSLPILENFLFNVEDGILEITASDLESTLISSVIVDDSNGSGQIAVPARLLLDTLKEFGSVLLTFDIDIEKSQINLQSESGKYVIMCQRADEFPQYPSLKKDQARDIEMDGADLLQGINNTVFAVSSDDLRPVLNGVFMNISDSGLEFASTDSNRLVKYNRSDIKADFTASFILPQKPALLLKTILANEANAVRIEFDEKNAIFTLTSYTVVCRLVEGNYPNYNAVIPKDNPSKVVVDRLRLQEALKRVSVYSNPNIQLVKVAVKKDELTVSAQDIDFSISGTERVNCTYGGKDIEIGFKASFLVDMLSHISTNNITICLADSSKAGLILPSVEEDETESLLMLLTPMMLN